VKLETLNCKIEKYHAERESLVGTLERQSRTTEHKLKEELIDHIDQHLKTLEKTRDEMQNKLERCKDQHS